MPADFILHGLADVWRECVRRFPRKTAVSSGGALLSYEQVDSAASSLAAALSGQFGVKPGDRVCIYMQNSVDFYFAYWAIHLAGGVVAAVSPRLGRREAGYVIAASGAEVLFHDKGAPPPASPGNLKEVIDGDRLRELAGEHQQCEQLPPSGPDDLAVLAHTSGTTGEPKIAEVTHANLLFNLRTAILAHSLRHEDVILMGGPMFHCTPLYSLMPAAAYLGATLIITAETSAAAQAMTGAEAGATVWFGVPTLFHQLAAAPGLEDGLLAEVRLLAYAGSPMRPQAIRRLRERWPHLALHNFFGLTETISMTHVLPSCDALERADSVGKVLPGVYVRIVGEAGAEVERGEVGELCFHRRNVIRSYWGKPGLLEKSFDGDWFRTGDLAREDLDGYLYLQGRSKDMIIVSGENVYAAEVEGVVARCPGVSDVAVVGVPATGVRASLGELIKAVVVRAPDAELKELDVKRFCSKELASYKIPHLVEFRDELPCNPSGKVLKEELK
jgi:long-chain acyl-CoA synthetase